MVEPQRREPNVSPDDVYARTRARVRRRPKWWLRRRDRRIVAHQPRPSLAELAELSAIRHELRVRR